MNKTISIIIPCYNEEKYVGECLDSIINQTYPYELIEVIVVDGNSNDKTIDIVQGYTSLFNQLIILNNPDKITPISLNIGVKKSTGDYIVILGAHSYIKNNFIQIAVEELNLSDAVCVGGPIINQGNSFIGNAIALAMQSVFGVGNSSFRVSSKRQYVDTIAFGIYKKEIFKLIGYFDETLIRNQDFELNQRIIQNGRKLLLVPEIQSYYYNRDSLIKLYKQYYNYGFWKERVVTKNLQSFKLRYQIPLIFIIAIISLGFGGFVNNSLWTYLSYLIILYIIISILNSFYLGLKNSIRYIPVLPIIYFVLHFSFGFGFLSSFLKQLFLLKKS